MKIYKIDRIFVYVQFSSFTLVFCGFPVDDFKMAGFGNEGIGRKNGGCCVDETELDAGETSMSIFARRGELVFCVILES